MYCYSERPMEDCYTMLTGSSTRAGTGCTDLHLIGGSVADCQALPWPIWHTNQKEIRFEFTLLGFKSQALWQRSFHVNSCSLMHKFRFVEFNSFANLIEKTLSDVFGLLSACGEIYIGRSMPVLATYFRTALSENYLLLIASPPAAEYALTFSRFQQPYFPVLA